MQAKALGHKKHGGEDGIQRRRAELLASQAERRAKKRTKEVMEVPHLCHGLRVRQ